MSRGPLRFNPREAGTDELSATLVGRHALIDELERRLVEDAAAATWRHWLVVGPRGVGKSHLCEVLSRRLRARGWTLVRFPEEHYRIHGLARLLEEIFVQASGQPSPFLDEPRADVVIEKALSALRRLRASSSRPLLVVLENLGMLLEQRMRDPADHARLRAILQHDPPFTLFATSPVWLDSTTQEGAPFYDFFQTYDLADLSADEVVELVRRRADHDLPADDPLRVSLSVPRGEAEARVRALHMLSGGNPRLVLVLYEVLRAGLSRDTRSQILQLIDDVTPYYQARLNDLSSQLQQVLTELCLAEQQITPAELARRCRMETNQVTANLTKLQRLRLVEPGERVDGRSRYWVVRERLLRIWLQVRERPEASARLVFLVEFFRVWFEGDRDGAEKHAQRYGEGVSVAMREGKVEEAMACIAGLEPTWNLTQFDGQTTADALVLFVVGTAVEGPPPVIGWHAPLQDLPSDAFHFLRILARHPEIFPHLLTLYDALSTTKVHEDPVAILHESWQVWTGAIPREALHPEMREAVDRFLSTQLLQDSTPLLAAEPPGTRKKPPRQRR